MFFLQNFEINTFSLFVKFYPLGRGLTDPVSLWSGVGMLSSFPFWGGVSTRRGREGSLEFIKFIVPTASRPTGPQTGYDSTPRRGRVGVGARPETPTTSRPSINSRRRGTTALFRTTLSRNSRTSVSAIHPDLAFALYRSEPRTPSTYHFRSPSWSSSIRTSHPVSSSPTDRTDRTPLPRRGLLSEWDIGDSRFRSRFPV